MSSRDILATTTDAALLLDSDFRISEWNRSAEEFFGYASTEVRGKYCWEVLEGVDVFGNRFCSRECPLRGMIRRREAIHPFDLIVRDALGRPQMIKVSTLVLDPGNPRRSECMHLFEAVVGAAPADRVSRPAEPRVAVRGRLTEREQEVLCLLERGTGTAAVARSLGISVATARNHISHLLRKLRVHSRLEAVVRARDLGLL
jgi:DNA-binding CsgD family transcriptional regulator